MRASISEKVIARTRVPTHVAPVPHAGPACAALKGGATLYSSKRATEGRPGLRRVALLIIFLLASAAGALGAAEETASPALQLEYHLVLTHPNLHLVTVEITAGKVSGDSLDFVMPAW